MTDTDTLDQAVQALAYVKKTKDEYQPLLDSLKEIEADNKPVVQDFFAATKTTQIKDHGVVVYQSTRESSTISDIAALKHVLEERGCLESYRVIDTAKVIAELSHVPEIKSLIRTTTTTSISTKLAK